MTDKLIEKIERIVSNYETSESDVDHLMTLIRKLQERTGTQGKYPLLAFFCDWTKHIKLDRNSEGHNIVLELNDQLYQVRNTPDRDTLINGLSQVISFERLQKELFDFLSAFGLPIDIVTKKKPWLRFVIHLINIITDCDLELPVKKRNRVVKTIKSGVVAISLKYKWINEGVFSSPQIVQKNTVLTFVISLNDTTTIVLPVKVLGKFITAKDNNVVA